jgi:enoyl-[acyl-carrier protein] reductase II
VRTALTELLGIQHPVMLAGMGGVSYHALTGAVSAAGGFGCLGASVMSNEEMVKEIRGVKAITDKPFGVDLLTAMPANLMQQVELLIDEGASVFVAGLGVPGDAIALCHERGVLVANMCGKVMHAVRAVDAGCDLVIAQGTEAGGHTGQVATMPLVPQIVDAVGDRVPVVAAGGIFDGRGLAAALALGAAGVWLGTRFIATPEARGVQGYKDKLLSTAEDGTTITRVYSGKTMRVLRNRYVDDWEASGQAAERFPMQAAKSMNAGVFHLGGDEHTAGVDPEKECYPGGQAAGGITALEPAGVIVTRIVEEAEQVLAGLSAARV